MKKSLLAVILTLTLLLTACSVPGGNDTVTTDGAAADTTRSEDPSAEREDELTETTSAPEIQNAPVSGSEEYFSDRDLEGTYEEDGAAFIALSGSTASCTSNAVQIDGSTVTITDEGTYILSGTLDDGMIIVNADKKDKTQIVLNGVSITSTVSAPIYVLQADKVFITTAPGTENTLSNGGSFEAIDENNIDAALFSKEDLTLNGSGCLTINSPAGHGVVSKDELTIAGGAYEINTASHGLCGKDNVCIAGGDLTIAAGKDGIQADNDEDTTLGFVWIEGGTFDITSKGDGISASSTVDILDGSFTILTGGGNANAAQQTSENWGGFMGGGGPMGGGGRGSKGGYTGTSFTTATTTTENDSTSIKGIKSGGDLRIWGGTFDMDCADDAIHSNANAVVAGGSFTIATGDDGFHAEENLTVSNGTINITESYEGLEGLGIDVSGGDIKIVSTDDGINAAGGTDQSGFGGMRGGDKFGGMSSGSSDSYIHISGGTIYMNASGDGIDSNGTLMISGGYTTVCGPTQGDTAVLDYEISGTITGGTFIGTGSYMMAQTFSSAENQGVIPVSVGSQSAGTRITLVDSNGNTLLSTAPELDFAIAILSSPDIVSGETYTLNIGSQSADIQAQ